MGALMARQAMRWAGPNAFLRRLSYRKRAMVMIGDSILAQGHIRDAALDSGLDRIECRMRIIRRDGIEIVRDATCVVERPGQSPQRSVDTGGL
jgi:hypothetical protein